MTASFTRLKLAAYEKSRLEQIPLNVGHIRNVRDTGDTRRT
jgi:hypothetical protein